MKRPKKGNEKLDFDLQRFLAAAGKGRTLAEHPKSYQIFLQGDPAEAIFYVQKGKIKLTVVSKQGKEAVVAILGVGDFFGEGCLAWPAGAYGQRQHHVGLLHHAAGKGRRDPSAARTASLF